MPEIENNPLSRKSQLAGSGRLPDHAGFRGLPVTVMGLGSFGGGVAAAIYLASLGAKVTVTDRRDAATLQASIDELKDVNIDRFFMGAHPDEAFQHAKVLVVNPGVKPDDDIVSRCHENGVIITSEIELFLSANSGRVVAVTGSNGKSTTTALIAHLLQPWADESGHAVWLGGNIGISLLPQVSLITKDDIVVLELSSFQLQYLRDAGFAPEVAVITNFAPNHLDWHENLEHYKSAKQVILKNQRTTQAAVICESNDEADGTQWRVRSRKFHFGTSDFGECGTYLHDGTLILRNHTSEDAIRMVQPACLPGQHNAMNIAAAACASWLMQANPETFPAQLRSFQMLPHRLQLVAEGKGLTFINDSVATTPESTIAALNTFRRPIVLIAGGADKGADLSKMAHAIAKVAHAVVLIGDTGHVIRQHLEGFSDSGERFISVVATDFANAFLNAVALAPEGAIVLLSPGCASFGWFRDYRDRGEQFEKLALDWTQA